MTDDEHARQLYDAKMARLGTYVKATAANIQVGDTIDFWRGHLVTRHMEEGVIPAEWLLDAVPVEQLVGGEVEAVADKMIPDEATDFGVLPGYLVRTFIVRLITGERVQVIRHGHDKVYVQQDTAAT